MVSARSSTTMMVRMIKIHSILWVACISVHRPAVSHRTKVNDLVSGNSL
jgi:hypothetical protein